MSSPFSEDQLAQLKVFVELCKAQPHIIHHPKLFFFKSYLMSLGVNLPTAKNETAGFDDKKESAAKDNAKESADEESESESDVELDMEGVIEGDSYSGQEMGDPDKKITDEDSDKSDEKRSEAMRAFSEQQYDEAIALYTEAIKLNPHSSLLFAKRGQVFLKQNKLLACIKDCTRALELNCDSAAGYKFRGRAYRLLGKFEEASHDLCESLKIDYDDQTNEWLGEVKPNAEKLRQHKLSVQRKKEATDRREKVRRARKAQEARAKAAADAPKYTTPDNLTHELFNLFSDPEVMKAMDDPETMAAFKDVSANPANFVKYQDNPKLMKALELLKKKMGHFGADPTPAAEAASKQPADDDVGLD